MKETITNDGQIKCLCGNEASIAIKVTNIERAEWQPNCQPCHDQFVAISQEVNEHEDRVNRGAFGGVTWEERSLEGSTQDANTLFLDFKRVEGGAE